VLKTGESAGATGRWGVPAASSSETVRLKPHCKHSSSTGKEPVCGMAGEGLWARVSHSVTQSRMNWRTSYVMVRPSRPCLPDRAFPTVPCS
jgi:hypothetical protein